MEEAKVGSTRTQSGIGARFEQFHHVRISFTENFSQILNLTGQHRRYEVDSFLLTPDTTRTGTRPSQSGGYRSQEPRDTSARWSCQADGGFGMGKSSDGDGRNCR